MKITLLVATTKDGFINHFGQKHATDWTSAEDQKHYSDTLRRYKLQLMGANTYKAYEDRMKPSPLYHRIIFTRTPDKYESLPGKMEFTNEPIPKALKRLEAEGFKHAALVGGGVLFTEFLELGLVDEVYLTIEPLEFGEGIPFLTDGHQLKEYTYLEVESRAALNDSGTVLLHYTRA